MPYARVGAMPQPSQQDSHQNRNSGNRGGRKKGITMEDLKKQTAMRLAQEQRKSNVLSGYQQPKEQTVHVPHILPQFPSPSYVRSRGDSMPVQYEGSEGMGGEVAHVPTAGGSDVDILVGRRPLSDTGPSLPSNSNTETQILPNARYPRSSSVSSLSSASLKSSSSQLESSSHHKQPTSKSKLPHGLTVQELKEMTKARLQAEAAEHHDTEKQGASSLYQSQQFQMIRERAPGGQDASSRDAANPYVHGQRGHFEAVGGHVSPLLVNKHITLKDSGLSIQSQRNAPGFQTGAAQQLSSCPPGFQSPPSPFASSRSHEPQISAGSQRESWPQTRMDGGWETASVASMNSTVGSEYLGSEAAYTPQSEEIVGEIPFARSRTYPTSALLAEKQMFESSPSFVPSGSFFEHSGGFAPNRRRASTLSPRPGLTHLHEDRPLLVGGTELRIPSFDASGTNRNPVFLRPQSDILSEPQTRSQSGGFISEDYQGAFNRPRTASAPSIPSFVSEQRQLQAGYHMDTREMSPNDLPNSVVESVLGASDPFQTHGDFTAVFRSSPVELESAGRGEASSLGSSGSLVQGRAQLSPQINSHWPNLQPGMAHQPSPVDEAALASGLDSVLKLSGIDGESGDNFVSRMDPEVSLFASGGIGSYQDASRNRAGGPTLLRGGMNSREML